MIFNGVMANQSQNAVFLLNARIQEQKIKKKTKIYAECIKEVLNTFFLIKNGFENK